MSGQWTINIKQNVGKQLGLFEDQRDCLISAEGDERASQSLIVKESNLLTRFLSVISDRVITFVYLRSTITILFYRNLSLLRDTAQMTKD